MRICKMVQSALYKSCNFYVNDNGVLTGEGERAFGCIRNGAILGAGALSLGIPLGGIVEGLDFLDDMTGCDNIVNFGVLETIGGLDTILNLLH